MNILEASQSDIYMYEECTLCCSYAFIAANIFRTLGISLSACDDCFEYFQF
jgi:hypothetical protein